MAEKGWLRKRPLRESSNNLLPLLHSNFTATSSGHRPTASRARSNNKSSTNGKPPLSSQSYIHGREHNCVETIPIRLAKSFSWSSLARMPAHQSIGGEPPGPTISPCTTSSAPQMKPSHQFNRRRYIQRLYQTNIAPYMQQIVHLLGKSYISITNIRPTSTQVAILVILQMIAYAEYRISHQLEWEIDLEWTTWEEYMKKSIRQSIPPPLNRTLHKKFSHLDNLKLFPDLQLRNVSEFAVPIPNYEKMAAVRGKLASNLRKDAWSTCQKLQQRNLTTQQKTRMSAKVLPVIGITVANDTPNNRYLRRILHTIDFHAVGSIVITWYDEHTEAQLLNDEPGLSHKIIEEALSEFIERFGFSELNWREAVIDANNAAKNYDDDTATSNIQLASSTSLELFSQTTTSIHQYCLYRTESNQQQSEALSNCQNELLILRFPTNLGCSVGVNNPLFTHPTSPYWLIANYDIAYPPKILTNMGLSVQNTLQYMPELAVQTFGYIYGRGQLENPWSNFVMTSCAVARVGVWDEDIYPAYYEDDDFRDRIRYVLGRWIDDYGLHEVGYEDAPTKRMEDAHLIRYQTDRTVAVAHGPLSAETYISGTHDTMQKVENEEQEEKERNRNRGFLSLFVQGKIDTSLSNTEHSLHYESLRWKTVRELADTER